ncbi:hypothetical protein [Streptomyces luteireticuli]|uniref:MFS transporter n=1 Tax=Streptomyces luteireticuli TaxID=173858 RepID=A0ABP3IST3_9ACTN
MGKAAWKSAALRSRTHDITTALYDHVLVHLRAVGLGALVDYASTAVVLAATMPST